MKKNNKYFNTLQNNIVDTYEALDDNKQKILKAGFYSVVFLILLFIQPTFALVILPILFVLLSYISNHLLKDYNKSEYKRITKNSVFHTYFNAGPRGEFATWEILNAEPGYKKILLNVFVPKNNGGTSEIDLIMINKYGVHVFESKNYSGSIYGSEDYDKWTQWINPSTKPRFNNPIRQNKTHIFHLKNLLEKYGDNVFKSYIVFSVRCSLKKIKFHSPNIYVIKRDALNATLKECYSSSGEVLSEQDIDRVYKKLQPYMNLGSYVKRQHVDNLEKKYGKKEVV